MVTSVKDKAPPQPGIDPEVKRILDGRYGGRYSGLIATLELRGVVPTMEQWPILLGGANKEHLAEYLTMLICGGVRAGKSHVVTDYEIGHKRFGEPELIWLGAANYQLTKPEFDYIADGMDKLDQLKKASKRVDPGYIELKDGTIYETKSAADPRTWAGQAPNRIYILEAAQVELDIYHRSLERLVEKRATGVSDGQLIMVGTLEGSLGYYPKLFALWEHGIGDAKSFSLPTWSNNYLFPLGRQDPEILRMEREMPEDVFLEHVSGVPVAPRGLVFPEFRPDQHVRKVEYHPDLPVYMWVDPGFSDACAYLFAQEVNGQIRIFTEIYERGKTAQDIIDMVLNGGMKRTWEQMTRRDGPGIFATEDIYGDQHHHMSSVAEIWFDKTGIKFHSKKVRSVNDVNERIKSFLKFNITINEPGLIIDPSCKGILSNFGALPDPFDGATRAYRWKLDREGAIYGDVPDDKANHSIKALGYGLVERFGYVKSDTSAKIPVKYW